jgi:hypothetical protein
MTEVILGRYALPFYTNGPCFFGSDAFWEPNAGVFGVATSTHHYDLYPIVERDVQAAFDIVHVALAERTAELAGLELLQSLLRAVHRGFSQIDVRTHLVGLEFQRSQVLPHLADDPESTPVVQIVLLQLQGRRLFIACVGNFLVYVVHSRRQELVFGRDWSSGINAVIAPDWPGPFIVAHRDEMPEIYTWDTEVMPGDLIIATTPTARLDQSIDMKRCDAKAADRFLRARLKSRLDDASTSSKSYFLRWGAAWAITCVEE